MDSAYVLQPTLNPHSKLNLATKTGMALQDAGHSKFRTSSLIPRQQKYRLNNRIFV